VSKTSTRAPHPMAGRDHAREGERVFRRHQEPEGDMHNNTMALTLTVFTSRQPLSTVVETRTLFFGLYTLV
jgi:hypothetical protein